MPLWQTEHRPVQIKRFFIVAVGVKIKRELIGDKVDRHQLAERRSRERTIDHSPEGQIQPGEKRAARDGRLRRIIGIDALLHGDIGRSQRSAGRQRAE